MTEPQRVLKDAALVAMGQAGAELRKRGWPVELLVDYLPETRTYAVSLRFELPSIPIPIEAEPFATADPAFTEPQVESVGRGFDPPACNAPVARDSLGDMRNWGKPNHHAV